MVRQLPSARVRMSPALICFALLLAGCGKPPQTAPATTRTETEDAPTAGQHAAVAGEAITAVAGKGMLKAEPVALASCEHAIVKLTWDATTMDPAPVTVKVHTLAPGETTSKLFAAGGAIGEATTGPWARSGHVFELRDDKGMELDRIVLGGPICK